MQSGRIYDPTPNTTTWKNGLNVTDTYVNGTIDQRTIQVRPQCTLNDLYAALKSVEEALEMFHSTPDCALVKIDTRDGRIAICPKEMTFSTGPEAAPISIAFCNDAKITPSSAIRDPNNRETVTC